MEMEYLLPFIMSVILWSENCSLFIQILSRNLAWICQCEYHITVWLLNVNSKFLVTWIQTEVQYGLGLRTGAPEKNWKVWARSHENILYRGTYYRPSLIIDMLHFCLLAMVCHYMFIPRTVTTHLFPNMKSISKYVSRIYNVPKKIY